LWRRFFNHCQHTEGTNITAGCKSEMSRLQKQVDNYYRKGLNVVVSAEEMSSFTEGARNLVMEVFKNFQKVIVMVCSSFCSYSRTYYITLGLPKILWYDVR